MKTTDLIHSLSAGDVRARPMSAHTQILFVGFLLSLPISVATGVWIGFRPDLANAMISVIAKATFSLSIALLSFFAFTRLILPAQKLDTIWRIARIFLGLYSVGTVLTIIFISGQMGLLFWPGESFPGCLLYVPAFALLTMMVFFRLAHRFAPTQLFKAGAAIGIFSGAFTSVIYSFACRADSLVYVAVWYGAAIALCGILGALLGPRLLRW